MANSLLVSVLGIVLVATVCNCLEFSYDYLRRPQKYFMQPDHKDDIKLLKRLNLEDGASHEQVIEGLRELMSKRDKEDVYIETWFELAKSDGQCSRDLPNLFVNLYANVRESTILNQKQLFLDTLAHYGAIKFESCASKALKAIESSQDEKKVVEAEKFFKKVLNLDEDVSDRDFYRKLKALSVTDADWNVGFLLSEAHDYDKQDYMNRNYVQDKYHFLFVDNCRNFEEHMTKPLNVVNLANDLNSNAEYFKGNDKLRELNELKRICMDLWRQKRGFVANLAKKISLRSRVLIPLKNKLGF